MNRIHHPSPDACIACSACVAHCPVAGATSAFLGPRLIGPAHERFRLLGLAEESSLPYCANCKNCDITCPHGVPVSLFNMLARAEQSRRIRPSLRDWMVSHGELLASLLEIVPAGLKNAGMTNPISRRILAWIGIAPDAPLPPFAPRRFRRMLPEIARKAGRGPVALFPGCHTDIYDPRTGEDIVALCNRAGYEAFIPADFVCCGLPLISNGFPDDAAKHARRNMKALAECARNGIPVITGCPSCALTLNADVREMFPECLPGTDIPPVRNVMEFLLDCRERGFLDMPDRGAPERVIYHAPCHLRAQGGGLPAMEALRSLPGVAAENADAGCCGISGSYGFKREKYDVAMKVGAALFRHIRESGASLALSECGTCRAQMAHGAGTPVLHPASFLRRRLEGGSR